MARDNYTRIYGAIQKEFDLSEVSADSIVGYITATRQIGTSTQQQKAGFKKGKQTYRIRKTGISSSGLSNIQTFAEEIAQANTIYAGLSRAEDSDTIEQLKKDSIKISLKAEEVYGRDLNSYFNKRENEIKREEKKWIDEQIRARKQVGDEEEFAELKQMLKEGKLK